MINSTITLKGSLKAVITDSSGNVKQEQEINNLIVDAGKNLVCKRLASNTTDTVTHMAVGTSGTAASSGQTALLGEAGRVALTSANDSTNTVVYVATFGAGTATGTLLEAGLFNDATTGTMLSRTASINVVKGASDTLTITWTITVS